MKFYKNIVSEVVLSTFKYWYKNYNKPALFKKTGFFTK